MKALVTILLLVTALSGAAGDLSADMSACEILHWVGHDRGAASEILRSLCWIEIWYAMGDQPDYIDGASRWW